MMPGKSAREVPGRVGRRGSVFAAAAAAVVLAGCGSDTPTLKTIALSPSTVTVPKGTTQQLSASGTYSDGKSKDLSSQVTWSSSAATVASVSAAGLVKGEGLGTATITAALGNVSGTAGVTVNRPPIGPGVDNDPLLAQQWHLKNTGQNGYADVAGVAGNDIAVGTTYQAGYSGMGVKVAVVDSGLEIAHEDLAANVVPGSWNFVNGTADPTSTATTGDHGTSVAGLIAAVNGNGLGGMGVAPAASLNGYNLIAAGAQTLPNFVAALGGSPASPKSNDVWIFNQSFGTGNQTDMPIDTTIEAQYASGATTLRGGKGALYVKAAGNGFLAFGSPAAICGGANTIGVSCQNASMDPSNTLPYNIVLGALRATGVKSSYSTAGSAIWVSAPGGQYGLNAAVAGGGFPANAYEPAMVTTDQSGCAAGYSQTGATTSSFNAGAIAGNSTCNYTNTMNGTSSATPVTSGVIALILDANPALTWRDVKHILAKTSTQVDAAIAPVTVGTLTGGTYTAELAWTTNAAGNKFHNWYGFGRVNVDAAVAMAKTYPAGQLGTFADTGWVTSGAISLAIPDNSVTGATSAIAVPATPKNLVIESVQISVTASHTYTGDLGIELTSPSGTKSILLNIQNGFNGTTGLNGMVLASNAFYGENSVGSWTIKVVDGSPVDVGTLTNWQIRIYGH